MVLDIVSCVKWIVGWINWVGILLFGLVCWWCGMLSRVGICRFYFGLLVCILIVLICGLSSIWIGLLLVGMWWCCNCMGEFGCIFGWIVIWVLVGGYWCVMVLGLVIGWFGLMI